MTRQNVIDKTTKKLKRSGFTDFEHDGSFDSETEQIIEYDFEPDFGQEYWWNGESFQTTPPE